METDDQVDKQRASGVRFDADERAWLEGLKARMYEGQTGAKPSFSSAIREAVAWGRAVLGEWDGDRAAELRRLQVSWGVPARDVVSRVVAAGLAALGREGGDAR